MKIGTYPAVYVKWLDAQSHDEWMDFEELEDGLPEIHTVGFLVSETKNMITLMQNYDETNGKLSMVMQIPKAWMMEMKMISDVGAFQDKN